MAAKPAGRRISVPENSAMKLPELLCAPGAELDFRAGTERRRRQTMNAAIPQNSVICRRESNGSLRSASRESSRAASGAASADARRHKFTIWPEWSDAEINAEKWEVAHKGKEKEKGKSPVAQHFFEDPEGKIILPTSLPVSHWKRPQEFILEKAPVVVDPDRMHGFDLISSNEHVLQSETIRWIISQIIELWQIMAVKATGNEPAEVPVSPEGIVNQWRPWEHIYAMTKVGKGPNIPQFNPYGKYAVKIFWMGCWRKIVVDDTVPFDDNDKCLLPCTAFVHELWPLLLTKALIKVCSLDYGGGSGNTEFGDFSVIHCLTGWLPQTILVKKGNEEAIWSVLKDLLPEWKLPETQEKEAQGEGEEKKDLALGSTPEGDKSESKEAPQTAKEKGKDKKDDKGKDKGKDGGKDKKDKEKDKGKEKTADEQIIYENPEVLVFASYHDVNKKNPFSILSLAEMADRSERLRQQGLSHLFSHPLLLNQVRACPLTPPAPPEVVPAWKLIRPRLDKKLPTSEEQPEAEEEVERPIRCIELQSTFLHYKVSPMPISTDTSRPRSALTRGATRPATPPHPPLNEADEENPSPEQVAAAVAVQKAKEEKEEQERLAREQAEREQREAIAQAAAAAAAAEAAETRRGGKKTSVASSKAKDDGNAGGKSTASPVSSSAAAAAAGAEEIDEEEAPEEPAEAEPAEPEPEHKMWMDMEIFCECFQAIHVYHKVHTYAYSKSFLDMKTPSVDERQPQYLFVDNLKPSEIIFCMSALCRWNEPPPPPPSHSAQGAKSGGKDRSDEAASVTDAAPAPVEIPKPQDIQPGSMICERHYWKTILVGDLFKRMRTSGVRAITLRLPEGRHCLKFYVRAPLGYHLQLASSTSFVYGDEEAVLPALLKDPQRLVAQAGQIMAAFGRVALAFAEGPGDTLELAEIELESSHCPPPSPIGRRASRWNRREHHRLWMESLYQTLKKSLPPDCLNADATFALRVLLRDATTKNPLGLTAAQSRPSESEAAQGWSSRDPTGDDLVNFVKLQKAMRGAFARKILRGRAGPDFPEHQRAAEALAKVWAALEPNAEAVGLQLLKTLIQLGGQQLLQNLPIAHDLRNHVFFTDYAGSYSEMPAGHWFVIFREAFHMPANTGDDAILMLPRLSCPSIQTACLRIVDNDTGEEFERALGEKNPPHRYRRNRAGYTFICVGRTMETALPAGKWRLRLIGESANLLQPTRSDLCSNFFVRELRDYYVPRDNQVLFRQCVRVTEDHLVTLQLKLSRPDVPVKLTILDNEEEVMTISGKGQLVLPAFIFYKDQVEGGEETRTSSRQSQRTTAAAAATVAAANKKRSSGSAKSPSQRQMSSNAPAPAAAPAPAPPPAPIVEEPPRQSSALSSSEAATSTVKSHKYVIKATIDRSAWPLSASNWAFIQTLRQQEKEELKMFGKNREPSPPKPAADAKKDAKSAAKGGGKGGGKAEKGKAGDKGKEAGSRPDSVTFDVTKAHWTMRIVSDNSLAEEFQVRRDTERAEQIRAMKKAWEDVEPGRAERARQSRLRFLNSHLVSLGAATDDETVAGGAASGEEGGGGSVPAVEEAALAPPDSLGIQLEAVLDDDVLTLEPPAAELPGTPKEMLPPPDLTPFLVGDPMRAIFKDYETRVREETEAKRKGIEQHRNFMADWEERLQEDKRARNRKKVQQIEDAYKLQGCVDSYREAYFRTREAFRQRLLLEEKRRQEELAAAESASQTDEKPKSPKGKKGSARASAKKGKKK